MAQSAEVFRFGPFEVDLGSQELRRGSIRIRLPGQSFRVLATLLERQGEVVSREELQRRLWPAESFGDFEHGLNAAVNRVRDALGDSADQPQYIETLPRRGYRFIASTEPAHSTSPVPASPPPPPAVPETAPSRVRTVLSLTPLAVLAAGLATALFFHFRMRPSGGQDGVAEDVTIVPLTTLPGQEISPAFSPDGSQVAFGWDGGKSEAPERFDLYVKVVGTENIERLTQHPSGWLSPAWSPDGSTIAFLRQSASGVGLFLISARGGPERRLVQFPQPGYGIDRPSWSPDGRELIYQYAGTLHVVTPETGAVRDFVTPSACVHAYQPTYSPDGSTVAFGCFSDVNFSDLYSMPRSGGTAKLILRSKWVGSFVWSSDGQRVIFTRDGALFEIGKDGGSTHRLPFAADANANAEEPAIALRGRRLAYVKYSLRRTLWRVDLQQDAMLSRRVLAPSTSLQKYPAISPDGKRISFQSTRSGWEEVWISNLDGSDAVQLTRFRASTGSASWSPDGRQLVLDSRVTGRPAIYLVDPATAIPRMIPIADLDPSVPTWSRDGHWIYFKSGNSRKPGVYKIAPGGGTPIHISTTEGWFTRESGDRKLLYFFYEYPGDLGGEIRVLSTVSGQERPLARMPKLRTPADWALTPAGIYFIADRTSTTSTIAFFDFASSKVTRRLQVGKELGCWGGLAVSPDGTWLAYTDIDEVTSDLMLAEGFR
ncbi:MAG: winged helix-turn-helix domain-containing protein [Acidobacteriaceae bacterium]